MQLIITTFAILVIVGQGHATFMRNDIWKSQGSLWLDAVTKAPYLSRPHMNLGKFLLDDRLAELFPVVRVLERLSKRRLGEGAAGNSDKGALEREEVHRLNESVVERSEHVLRGYAAVGEGNLACR